MAKIGELRQLIKTDFLANGVISGAEAKRLVEEVKGGTALSSTGRNQLTKLLDEFSANFSSAGRKQVFGELGLSNLPDASELQGDIATAIASNKTAVTTAEAAIGSITVKIDDIEQQNATKMNEVNSLISQIESRKNQLKGNRRRNRNMGMIGAMFGMPSVAMMSLVNIYDDDSRLRSLDSDLKRATADVGTLQTKATQYRATKTRMTGKLKKLQAAATSLRANIGTGKPAANGPLPAHQMRALRSQAELLSVRVKLLNNLENQVEILTDIRDEASGLGGAIDVLLVDVNASAVRAKKHVEASHKAVLKMVEFFLSPNPETAAAKYLNKRITKMTNELLNAFNLKVGDYAKSLAQSISPNDAAYAKALTSWLTKRLKGQNAGALPKPSVQPSADLARLRNDLASARADGLAARDALASAFSGS